MMIEDTAQILSKRRRRDNMIERTPQIQSQHL